MNEPSDSGSFEQKAAQDVHAGGDITIGDITQTVNQFKPDFLEPNLEQFDSSDFTKPSADFISELIEMIQKNRLLVLGGGDDIDKAP
jgi:hypothetical protein